MTDKTILITRLFDAPRELVFECWMKPEHLLHWYSAGGGWTTQAFRDRILKTRRPVQDRLRRAGRKRQF